MYGLTELAREQVKGARLLANPGCYPTCSQVLAWLRGEGQERVAETRSLGRRGGQQFTGGGREEGMRGSEGCSSVCEGAATAAVGGSGKPRALLTPLPLCRCCLCRSSLCTHC